MAWSLEIYPTLTLLAFQYGLIPAESGAAWPLDYFAHA